MFVTPGLYRLLAAATAASSLAQAAGYRLIDAFDPSNFFSEFDFFGGPDPTDGFVRYVDKHTANREGLAGYAQGGVYLGVDYQNTTTTGRASVRVTSKKSYTEGLFIADIVHMPAGAADQGSCGLWPALWMFSKNSWPAGGEMDLMEGVNTQSNNSIVLHTSSQCRMANTGATQTTKFFTTDCQGDIGCRQEAGIANTYGAGFNARGGGIYALEWADRAISTWFFPRGSPMANTLSTSQNSVNTTSLPGADAFGPPLASFVAIDGCSINDSFRNQSIVINTAFCGQWAGTVWTQDRTCAALARTCADYVGANPGAFAQAYWLINSIRVYQQVSTRKRTPPGKQAVPFTA